VLDVLDLLRKAVDVDLVDPLHDAPEGAGGRAVELLQHVHDLAFGAQHAPHLQPGGLAHGVQRGAVEGIAHGEREHAALPRDRDELALLHELVGEHVFEHRHIGVVGPADRGHPQVLRDHGQEVLLGDVAQIDEHLPQLLARLALEIQCGAQFLLVDQAALEEDLADRFA